MLENLSKVNRQNNTYYVSDSIGSDSNTLVQARNPATPWKTINKVNQSFSSMTAGDSVLFKRGEQFYGALVPTRSGTTGVSGETFNIGAYGTGIKPKLTGMSPITAWSGAGSNLYVASVPTNPASIDVVTIGGIFTPFARFPKRTATNGGYLTITTSTGSSITSTQLTGTANWVGAEVVSRSSHFVMNRGGFVTSINGTTFSFSPSFAITNGYGFFFQNHISAVTQNNEWSYDTTKRLLYMYSNTGTPVGVSAATVQNIINTTNISNLVIKDLIVEGCNGAGISINAVTSTTASNVFITNCDVKNTGQNGIESLRIINMVVNNNTIDNAMNCGLRCNNFNLNNFKMIGNRFTNIGYLDGLGGSGAGLYIGARPIMGSGSNIQIIGNYFYNIGFNGIHYDGNNVLIKNNIIDTYCSVMDGGAGIYTYNGANNSSGITYSNRLVVSNIVRNSIGAPNGTANRETQANGIYQDNNTNNVNVYDNTIYNIINNAFINNSTDTVNITGNTAFNCNQNISYNRYINDGTSTVGGRDIKNCIFSGNTLINLDPNSIHIEYTDFGTNYPSATTVNQRLANIGVHNYNKYYFNNEYLSSVLYRDLTGSPWIRPLMFGYEQYKLFSSLDANSVRIPKIPLYTTSKFGNNMYANSGFTALTGVQSFGANQSISLDTTGKLTGGISSGLFVLDAQPRWELNDRTDNNKINFSSGLTIPGSGMTLIDFGGQRWIKSEVDYYNSPNVGLSKRDECQVFKNGNDLFVKNKFYSFDMYLPNFAYDNRNMSLMQIKHISTYNGQKIDYYPFITLGARPQNGVLKFAIIRQWSNTYAAPTVQNSVIEWMDTIVSDKYYRFAFEVNWSNAADGYIKVYMDGVLAYTFNGPNIDPPPPTGSAPQPLFRIGHYQFTWSGIPTPPAVTNRKAYYRNLKVGNSDMTINDFIGLSGSPNSVRVNVLTAVTIGNRSSTTVFANIGTITGGQKYIMRCSIFGTSNYGIMTGALRYTNSPFSRIVPVQTRPFSTGRTDYEFFFEPTLSVNTSWEITVSQFAGTSYIGNVQVFPVTGSSVDINTKFSFQVNDTEYPKTIALGGTYTGISDNIVYTAVTLQPYSSKVFMRN
jgi:hypothetical protein